MVRLQILALAHSNAWRSPAHFDHDRLRIGCLGGQAHHDPGEDTVIAPALPTVIKRLSRSIFLWCVSPSQAVAIDNNNSAEDPPIIDTWPAMALWKGRAKARHLRFDQPEQVAHQSSLFAAG